MQRIGQQLRQQRFTIGICFTSLLKRAVQSLFVIQEEMDLLWVPVCNTWRLNDRMLGNLTGFHRDRAAALFGERQLREWLIPADSAPPPSDAGFNLRCQSSPSIIPATETRIDLSRRLQSFVFDELLTNIYEGRNVLVVSHEETLKELIRLLKDYSIDDYAQHHIPIGVPIVFEFQCQDKLLSNAYYFESPMEQKRTEKIFRLGLPIDWKL